ncbi:MAG: chloramphenicol phosphotransferase [bacterium]
MPPPGRIVCLNGTSSAGKSSIAGALQELLHPEVWLVCGIDTFLSMGSASAFEDHSIHYWRPAPGGGVWCDPMPAGMRLLAGGYRAAAALALAGNNVVFDDVSLDEQLLKECADSFSPFDSLFVGVRCDIDVLVQRELQRGDRRVGAAVGMAAKAHEHASYDIEVDTTSTSSDDCARRIIERLNSGPPGTALAQLSRT